MEKEEYFKILSKDFPVWLNDYINTIEMQRQDGISMNCGTDYSKLFNLTYRYSNLDHSIAVALIIWNFTHDKKQTLAGLFHDIATPVFKHCIDFMNGDSEKQESTEEKTYDIIKNSKEIMNLLKKDNIKIEDVCDYKIYPIADNSSPKLSADRFEYNFSGGLSFFRIWQLSEIKEVYDNIIIVKNEDNIDELAFKDKEICEKYISKVSKLWPKWVSDEDRLVMQFIADMCISMNSLGSLSIEDLYTLSESDIIEKFKNCNNKKVRDAWNKFLVCDNVIKPKEKLNDKYGTNVKVKTRYINPLVLDESIPKRIYDISEKAKKCIDSYLELPKGGNYVYFDFDFEPIKIKTIK